MGAQRLLAFAVGLMVGPAEAWMRPVEREDPEYERGVLREESDSEPWPDEVDGSALLSEAAEQFRTYVRFPADLYYVQLGDGVVDVLLAEYAARTVHSRSVSSISANILSTVITSLRPTW